MFRKCVEGSEQLTIDSREIINRSYIQAMQITSCMLRRFLID